MMRLCAKAKFDHVDHLEDRNCLYDNTHVTHLTNDSEVQAITDRALDISDAADGPDRTGSSSFSRASATENVLKTDPVALHVLGH